ncbi:hypothetical protein FHY10_003146 [Xanthomonas arboricola]|nr:hypothetical protein [Xanthomonas arboricola]
MNLQTLVDDTVTPAQRLRARAAAAAFFRCEVPVAYVTTSSGCQAGRPPRQTGRCRGSDMQQLQESRALQLLPPESRIPIPDSPQSPIPNPRH